MSKSENNHKGGLLDPKSLEALRLHHESILASVPDAMVVIDDAGAILEFSRAAQDLFGYSDEDVIGQNVNVLMTSRDQAHHDGYITQYLKTHEPKIIGIGRVVMAKHADGREFPIDLKIGEAKIDNRSVFTGFMRDLTDQKNAEVRMQAMQSELVNFSRLSAVGTMASALAHELNQPLTAIANYLEAGRDLLETPDEATIIMVQEALSEAARQSVRAGQIVRKLRDFVARGEISARPVKLDVLLEDAVSLARIGMDRDGVYIKTHYPDNLPEVMVDPIQIQQVIVNLIRNSIEAMTNTADPEIQIEARTTPESVVCLAINDNGPGIAPDIADGLFRPFTSSKSKGMGLGLSICQTIIEAHGGTLGVASTGPAGTCFEFTLPLKIMDPTDAA